MPHGRHVQGQGGISLSDIYDVKGGQFPSIEDVETRTPQTVHELGKTIFAERLNGRIRRISTGNINQSTAFDNTAVLEDFTDPPTRIMGVTAFASAARLDFATVSIRSSAVDREVPFWAFDTVVDASINARMQDNGGAAGNVILFRPGLNLLPAMVMGNDQPGERISSITVRGQSSAFGAGTVNVVFLIYYASSEVSDAVSSYGLPVPSW